jgi:hypothetical protein
MMKTPTPPPLSALIGLQHDTPHSHGSASNSSFYSAVTQKDYSPYLRSDLRSRAEISLSQFMHMLGAGQVDNLFSTLPHDSNLTTYIRDYKDEVYKETQRYDVFIKIVNQIIELTAKMADTSKNVRFCRNDPVHLTGSHAKRKPDILCVPSDPSGGLPHQRINPDSLSQDGPRNHPFHWAEPFFFCEMKKDHSSYSAWKKGQKALPPKDSNTYASSSSRPNQGHHHSRKVRPWRPPRVRSQTNPQYPPTPPLGSSPRVQARSRPQHNPLSGNLSLERPQKRAKKVTSTRECPEELLQCASYALEFLSNGGLRSHVLGILVTDFQLRLLYYDRSIHVVSQKLDFLDELPTFLWVMHSLTSLSQEEYGFQDLIPHQSYNVPRSIPSGRQSFDLFRGLQIKLKGITDTTLQLEEILYQNHGLIGRGTTVLSATSLSERWKGEPLIVKLSYPPTSRMSEKSILDSALEKAVGQYQEMRNHLPEILHSEDIQGPIQQILSKLLGEKYEKRVLRLIVQKKLNPITELTDAVEVALVYRDVLKCESSWGVLSLICLTASQVTSGYIKSQASCIATSALIISCIAW